MFSVKSRMEFWLELTRTKVEHMIERLTREVGVHIQGYLAIFVDITPFILKNSLLKANIVSNENF